MSEPLRLFSLPFELRAMIWEFSLPDRIVELGEPADPDILPANDLRKAWVLNRKMPTIAHLCHESREFAKRQIIPVPEGVDPECMPDIRVWLKYSKTIHFNAPDYHLIDRLDRFNFEDNLTGSHNALELGKKLSISADLIRPFIRFHDVCEIKDPVVHHFFLKLKGCIVALHTVCIRATKQQARDMGLFGFGEEPAQLIDPFDKNIIRQYKALWDQTPDGGREVSAAKFFDTVNTQRFTFRTERWLAHMEALYMDLLWPDLPDLSPSAGRVMNTLRHDPRYRHHPEALQYLHGFPKLDLRIMFRLCPPVVDNVIT